MKQTLEQLRTQRHRCGINDIREFITQYVTKNCRRNITRDNEYKVTTACFHAWHYMKYGTKAAPQCIRTLILFLPAIAQEQQLKIEREGNAKYVLTRQEPP